MDTRPSRPAGTVGTRDKAFEYICTDLLAAVGQDTDCSHHMLSLRGHKVSSFVTLLLYASRQLDTQSRTSEQEIRDLLIAICILETRLSW